MASPSEYAIALHLPSLYRPRSQSLYLPAPPPPPCMVTREVTVRNRAGVHTRPASMIVREASRFESEFFIKKDGYEINGKSIIGVMTLAAEQGATLDLLFEGSDEDAAADALEALFERGFGEAL